MQGRFVAESGAPAPDKEQFQSEGVATIAKIRASLQKRNAKLKGKEHS